jgi:cephalosporin hydroxylase
MKLSLDTEAATLTYDHGDGPRTVPLYGVDAFDALNRHWVRVGWSLKYVYGFSWLGRPIIQLPDDLVRIQELIHAIRPDYVIETGVAHGGSLVFYASLFEAMGHGRVIGVDIEIRPHNRVAIEAHPLFHRITLVEGSSTAPDVVARVRSLVPDGSRVLVLLDSNHSRAHVRDELEAYAPFVGADSWIVATDGVMEDLSDVPRGHPEWRDDNPCAAAADFLAAHPEWEEANPPRPFDEGAIPFRVTHWPRAYLRRRPTEA